jgi:hypothetical protein
MIINKFCYQKLIRRVSIFDLHTGHRFILDSLPSLVAMIQKSHMSLTQDTLMKTPSSSCFAERAILLTDTPYL